MPNWFFTTLQKLMPSDGREFRLVTPASYRALKPTWPVVASLLFLALAMAVPDQGRAILKFTALPNKIDIAAITPVFVLLCHSCVMMYSALLLTAVSRRKQLNVAQREGTHLQDPVNQSINLRLGFSYVCGIFLPLLFMLLSISFQYELTDPTLLAAMAIGLLLGYAFYRLASWLHPSIAELYANINQPSQLRLLQNFGYTALNILRLITRPSRRLAASAVAGIFSFLLALEFVAYTFSGRDHILTGAWMFFIAFLFVHILQRVILPKLIRLHQGQTSRYIVIDPTFERDFGLFCWVLLPSLIILLWIPIAVDFLGPLGVGLIGTMWITIALTFLVERPARFSKQYGTHAGSPLSQVFSKPFIFTALIFVLLLDSVVNALETLVQVLNSGGVSFSLDLFMSLGFVVILITLIVMRNKIWGDGDDSLSRRIGRLPTMVFLSPLFFLSFGEAHHLHRIDADKNEQVHTLREHAKLWIESRMSGETSAIPVIVVLAEGGGIRAAAHTGYFLSHLDNAIIAHCATNTGKTSRICQDSRGIENKTRLLDHVYSVNGVSGGSVGAAIYLAAVRDEKLRGITANDRHRLIDNTIRTDLMSPLLAGLLGSDLLTGFIPVQLPDRLFGLFGEGSKTVDPAPWPANSSRGVWDRADFFENRLAESFDDALQNICSERADGCTTPPESEEPRTFDVTLERIARQGAGELTGANKANPGPVVFFSTFYETGGFQMATANVDIDIGRSAEEPLPFCGSVPIVQQLLNFSSASPPSTKGACHGRSQTLPLSAAAHLSARFPGANPTGVIETRQSNGGWQRHFFLDGGYLDNSGTMTALQSIEALRQAATEINPKVSLNVIVLQLYALPVPEQGATKSRNRPTKRDEITKIPSAALKARGAASRAPIRMFCNALAGYAEDSKRSSCDLVFSRRRIPDGRVVDANEFKAKLNAGVPVLDDYISQIPLRERKPQQAAGDPITGATWIPIPLEVARSDRQENAITALLGWTLLDETSDNIDDVMSGAAKLAITEILSTTGNAIQNDAPGDGTNPPPRSAE